MPRLHFTTLARMSAADWRARVASHDDAGARADDAVDRADDRAGGAMRRAWMTCARVVGASTTSTRLPRVDAAKLERFSDRALGRLRARCARALESVERGMGDADAAVRGAEVREDVEDGRNSRGMIFDEKTVEALAKTVAVGDKSRREAVNAMRAIDAVIERRRRRRETRYTRRIEAIPRDATRLIDEYGMRRFIHRGIDVEGLDDAVFERFFDRCLEGLENEGFVQERLVPVDHLVRLVKSGLWGIYWKEYADGAMVESLKHGCSGISISLYAIGDTDPLGEDAFEGIPSASTLLSGPSAYLWCLFQLMLLPTLVLLGGFLLPSVRRTLHMARFMFSSSLWRAKHVSSSFVALALCYTPYWGLGMACVILFLATETYEPGTVLDVIVPATLSLTITSFVATCLASVDVNQYSKMSAVTLFFPGGKTELPDGDSKLVQEHPTVDTLRVREIPVALRVPHSTIGANDSVDELPERTNGLLNGESKRKNGKSGDQAPRWMVEMGEFASNLQAKTEVFNTRTKSSKTHSTKHGAQNARRDVHAKDSIEDIIAKNKLLQLKSITEADVVNALLQRTNEEILRTYWFRVKSTWFQQASFLLMAIVLSLLPFLLRRVSYNLSAFGQPKQSGFCIRDSVHGFIPSFVGLQSCPASVDITRGFVHAFTTDVSTMDGTSGNTSIIIAFCWNVMTLHVIFVTSRWICSCTYHRMLYWLFFQASTDPSTATSYDVPYVNLCQAWLPWIRIRMVVEDHRELEQYWCQYYLTHFVALVSGILIVGMAQILRLFFMYDFTSIASPEVHAPIYPLIVSTVLTIPIIILTSTAAKVQMIQERDVVNVQEARWKLFLDNSTILNAGMEKDKADIVNRNKRSIEGLQELERILERRNADAWPSIFGFRIGEGAKTASYALGFISAALAACAIAIDAFQGARSNSNNVNVRDMVRLGIAHLTAIIRTNHTSS